MKRLTRAGLLLGGIAAMSWLAFARIADGVALLPALASLTIGADTLVLWVFGVAKPR